ncbi:uncharacterized protein ACB057_007638 [Neosynchiropus ocellatus]
MARMFLTSALALLLLSACCCWAAEEEGLSVSELLERANRNLMRTADEAEIIEGDIAIDESERNADPCTSRGCMWGKWTDGNVYVPYYISNKFSSREKSIITRGLESFSSFSCIRFRPSRSSDRDWLSIESQSGCWSYVGRRGGKQVVSLARRGCLYHGTVQHELLHALGFNHEQTRSDRDNHIKVVLSNVLSGKEHNFRKIATLNQGTPYDYGSVMQYSRYAFSKNNRATMVPIPDANVSIGHAKEMSRNDIARLNTLYKCSVVPTEDQNLSVSELLLRANRDRQPGKDEPTLIGGDIAIGPDADRNADPCTSYGCLWLKNVDGNVYIPYYIANHFSSREVQIIVRGLDSFSSVSCIRFRPYQQGDHEWLSIESRDGCWSYVGRQGGGQVVSLARQGCLYHGTVQHELLHALGFNHEQTRSDRDSYIQVYWQNIIDGMAYNFDKINTLNQGTPYDYNSVMQYERYAFSKNNQPTMVPIPNPNVSFGQATQMSRNDIDRINRLYNCCESSEHPHDSRHGSRH